MTLFDFKREPDTQQSALDLFNQAAATAEAALFSLRDVGDGLREAISLLRESHEVRLTEIAHLEAEVANANRRLDEASAHQRQTTEYIDELTSALREIVKLTPLNVTN